MKEYEDVPRQKRSDVALDEPCDCGSEDPFKVVQALNRPLGTNDRTFENSLEPLEPPPECISRQSTCSLVAKPQR
jgi:hypothetical protein